MGNWLLVVVPKKPRVSKRVIETMITICIESGVISLASVVLPVLFDRGSLRVILFGVTATAGFWIAAIVISWRINE